MRALQIENWALNVIDTVKAGKPNEDFRAELKADWIDEHKAARRIAGQANAAHGKKILWLIGVCEKRRIITDVDRNDFADWYMRVEKYFNELSPDLIDLNIRVDNKTVVALLFDTNRAFVIKNPEFGKLKGQVELEVPWREGTRIRTARRSDLIKLLAPLELLPKFEVINGDISISIANNDEEENILQNEDGNWTFDALYLSLKVYVVLRNKTQVVIPNHHCRGWFEIPGIAPKTLFGGFRLTPYVDNNRPGMWNQIDLYSEQMIKSTPDEAIINGCGMLKIEAYGDRPTMIDGSTKYDIFVSLDIYPTNTERPATITYTVSFPSTVSPS